MKKPLIGIISICLLQVVFVAYNAFELPVDMSAVMPINEMVQAPVAPVPPRDDIVVFRSGKTAGATPFSVTAQAPVFISVKREKLPVSKSGPTRSRVTLAVQKTPVRTEYPAVPVEYREPQNAVAASIVTRQAKKKSFFSKALPIIKKPYDWAKAFAGKLK